MSESDSIKIEGCDVEWKLVCPNLWKNLSKTAEESVRFCGECKKNVYFSRNVAQIKQWGSEGKCTAFEYGDDKEPFMDLGIPADFF